MEQIEGDGENRRVDRVEQGLEKARLDICGADYGLRFYAGHGIGE